MKTIRQTAFALFLLLISFLAVSCNEIVSDEESKTNACEIRIALGDLPTDSTEGRTVKPDKLVETELSYKLVATKGNNELEEYWATYEEMIRATLLLDAGEWSFTLDAYTAEGKDAALHGVTTKEIKNGTNTLNFDMKQTASGVGSFCMNLTLGKDPDFTQVKAKICNVDGTPLTADMMGDSYNPETDGSLEQIWTSEDFAAEDFDGTVTFAVSDNVPTGSYLLFFTLTDKNGEEREFPAAVYVAPGNNSTDSYDVSKSGTHTALYSVTYSDGVDNEEIEVPVDEALYKAGDAVTVKSSVERIGYTFGSWVRSDTGGSVKPGDSFEMPDKNLTLTPNWIPAGNTQYSVEHHLQNVNETKTAAANSYTLDSTTIEQKYGVTLDLTEAEPRVYTGYTAQSVAQKTIAADGSTVVVIRYDRNTDTVYRVEHYLQDLNENKTDVVETYTIDGSASEKKTGITGVWTAAAAKTYTGFTAQPFEQAEIAADGSTIVNIYYNRDRYGVTYADGVADETITVPESTDWCYEATVTVASAPTRTGYTFACWNRSDSAAVCEAGSTFTMPAAAVTLTAAWTANTNTAYNVNHHWQNLNAAGTGVQSTYTLHESEQMTGTTGGDTSAVEKTYTGFTAQPFSQTKIAADGSTVVDIYYNRNSDTVYTVRHYKQNLNPAGTDVSGTDITADYTVDAAAPDSRAGTTGALTVVVAETYEGFTAQPFEQTAIAADGSTVVNIYYNRNTYTVTYNDGVANETITVPESTDWCYGATVTVSNAVPKRTGYTFLGWAETDSATSATYSSAGNMSVIMGAAPVTLYAVWAKNAVPGGNIIITANEYTDMQIFTCELTGTNKNVLTFTGEEGYDSYEWWIGIADSASGDLRIYEWDTSSVSAGTYDVTLIVTDSSGVPRSQVMTIVIGR